MSILYSISKPVLRASKPKKSAMTVEDWESQARKLQGRFRFELPEISGYEVRDEMTDGYHCIVIAKPENQCQSAVVYYAGGGYIRYQLPNQKSVRHYIEATGRDLWIPLYPLFPDHTMYDAVRMAYSLHQNMLGIYKAENIAWMGFSAGANIVMGLGRYIIQENNELPMPEMIISVSGCNMHITEESRKRMDELDRTDVMFPGNQMELFKPIFDPDGSLPRYITGCAAENDYTGFPRTILVYGGDEVMSGEAPEYEKAFRRCGVTDYKIHIEPNAFHGYPVFTFTPEGKKGEEQMIRYLNGD